MKKILITGAPGFAASHLIEVLSKDDNNVIHGTKRVRSDMYRLEKLGVADKVCFHLIEMTDAISVHNVIAEVMPDQIYHLAAQDYVKSSWDSPIETFNTNVNGLINLYEAVRRCYPRITDGPVIGDGVNTGYAATQVIFAYPKILVTSTAETYGYHFDPIHELTEQNPLNPYGVSKLAMDKMAQVYAKAYEIPTVITRAFNVSGWGRNDPFVDSDFAKQIAGAEVGFNSGELQHGDLSTKRSFFDVKDCVSGYIMAMEYNQKESCEVFCFGPDKSTSIQELLDVLIGYAQVSITTHLMQDRLRPLETIDMRCDTSKAKQVLGWEPKVPLDDSLKDLLQYWRERL